MTNDFYRTGIYEVDHSIYGGLITEYDFNGYTSMSQVANEIVRSQRFDRSCKTSKENTDNYKRKNWRV